MLNVITIHVQARVMSFISLIHKFIEKENACTHGAYLLICLNYDRDLSKSLCLTLISYRASISFKLDEKHYGEGLVRDLGFQISSKRPRLFLLLEKKHTLSVIMTGVCRKLLVNCASVRWRSLTWSDQRYITSFDAHAHFEIHNLILR